MEPDSPTEAPPPAYDVAQQDFDRKISDALQISLTIADPPVTQPVPTADEEEWEEWDEAAFEAAAARAREQDGTGSTSAQLPPQPLSRASSQKRRFATQDAAQAASHSGDDAGPSSSRTLPSPSPASEKQRLASQDAVQARSHRDDTGSSSSNPPRPGRLPPSPTAPKQRPRWLQVPDSQSSSGQYEQSTVSPPQSHIHQLPAEDHDEHDHDEPLPPFAPVGPSLDGPPFEEVMRLPRLPPITDADSPPQSPLDSVEDAEIHHGPPPAFRHRAPALSRPPPPASPAPPALAPPPSTMPLLPRPASSSSSFRHSTMPFDTNVAYTARERQFNAALHGNQLRESESREVIDASALYNSSVSSLLKSRQTPMTPRKSNSAPSAASGGGRSNSFGSDQPALPPVPQGMSYQSPQQPQLPQLPQQPQQPQLPQQPQQPLYNNTYPSQNPVQMPTPYSQPRLHSPAPPVQPQMPYIQQQPSAAASFYAHPFQNVPLQQQQPQWPPAQNNPYGGYQR